MRLFSVIIIATGAVLAIPAAAPAGIIAQADLPSRNSNAAFTIDGVGVDVASHNGTFHRKQVAGVSAVGVSGGSVHGEIDGGEFIQLTFNEPMVVSSISIAHLYTAGNYGDVWNETAKFATDRGDFFLEALSPTTASWTGNGIVLNDDPGAQGHGGAWTVSGEDIFGGAINWLKLMPGNAGSQSKFGDYGFVGLAGAPIPAPGVGALIMLASLVTGRSRRRLSTN